MNLEKLVQGIRLQQQLAEGRRIIKVHGERNKELVS